MEELSRGYARAMAPLIGDQINIPAPDVGANAQIMAWMVDEYSKLAGRTRPAYARSAKADCGIVYSSTSAG